MSQGIVDTYRLSPHLLNFIMLIFIFIILTFIVIV
jgi:phage shock protein PspC (stress-responsive transcriptional regulator)